MDGNSSKVKNKNIEENWSTTVRFAGDSGDGMQLTGGRLTFEAAISGMGLATFPDYPAEIRAPAGTTFGVSSFQVRFGKGLIASSGDHADILVAMNPAALKVNIKEVLPGGLVILDSSSFNDRGIKKAARARSCNRRRVLLVATFCGKEGGILNFREQLKWTNTLDKYVACSLYQVTLLLCIIDSLRYQV